MIVWRKEPGPLSLVLVTRNVWRVMSKELLNARNPLLVARSVKPFANSAIDRSLKAAMPVAVLRVKVPESVPLPGLSCSATVI